MATTIALDFDMNNGKMVAFSQAMETHNLKNRIEREGSNNAWCTEKANMVVDALSRKSMGSLAHLEAYQRPLAREVHRLPSLGVRLADSSEEGVVVQSRSESSLVVEVKEKQGIHKHKTMDFSLGINDGTPRYQGRLFVPSVDGLWERIMIEAHIFRYSLHPGSIKMYHDLKEVYWLNDMKRNVGDFVAKCPNCQ
ncbi:uncharacterized protein [Nicotiana sylvestris]|uniref:uncharacterized protein n=1 Tax=Nicotiana sylvestris TaxID=4096 RepID=UPI00388CA096